MKKPSISSKKQQTSISIQKHKYYYLVIFLGLSSILFLTSLTQTLPTRLNSQVSATSNDDGTVSSSSSVNASVTVGVGSCTFERDTVSGGNGTYTGTLANGATPIEVDGSIFEIKCNDGGGSAIYAIGYSNDEITNTDLISSLGSDTNIHTGVYNPEDTTHDSSWAMKMKAKEGGYSGATPSFGDFSTFQPIPDNYTMVASYPSSTLDPTGTVTSGGKIQAVYQAYASYTQPAGTYTGQVKYTMVHPNTADSPTITFDEMFASKGKTKLNGYYKMQDMSSDICSKVTTEQQTTLIDTRDNQEYTVAKLKDNKCWMTKNLNIAGGTALSSDDTDFEDTYTLPTTNGWTTTGENNERLVLPESSTAGFDTNNYSYIYNSGRTDCSSLGCYSYYSWDAATLGSGRDISTDNTDAPYSICPKSWKLPSTYNGVNSSTDLRALIIAYGGSINIQSYNDSTSPKGSELYAFLHSSVIPNFLLSGYYGGSSLISGGSRGFYWSSTSGNLRYEARNLNFNASLVYSAGSNTARSGFAVRCLAK